MATETELSLPPWAGLGQLANTRPVLVQDTREQVPLVFTRLRCVRGTIGTGDYSILGLLDAFSVEKKSIDDLVNCCTADRDRFARELCRLRGYKFKRLLILGSRAEIELQRYHSWVSPKAVLGSLAAWECRYDVPVVYASSPVEAARMVEGWAFYFSREYVRAANELLRAAQNDEPEGEQ